ncbi:MAG TPA: hypothetical protein VM536_20905 [Chloroflexia bacterium]|nr:hypothetical protein [Chloroflexia bacterium]
MNATLRTITRALPHTRAHGAQPATAFPLLDTVMPVYHVARRQSRVVRAPATAVYDAALKAATANPRGDYTLLSQRAGRELLLGGTHPLARRTRGTGVQAWVAYQAPGASRTALALRVEPVDYQTARLHSETRLYTRGLPARLLMQVAWTVLAPVNRLRRRGLLRDTQRAAEQASGLFLLTP